MNSYRKRKALFMSMWIRRLLCDHVYNRMKELDIDCGVIYCEWFRSNKTVLKSASV